MIYSVIKEDISISEILKRYDIDLDIDCINESFNDFIKKVKEIVVKIYNKIAEFIDTIAYTIKTRLINKSSKLLKEKNKILQGYDLLISKLNGNYIYNFYNLSYVNENLNDIFNIEDFINYHKSNGKSIKNIDIKFIKLSDIPKIECSIDRESLTNVFDGYWNECIYKLFSQKVRIRRFMTKSSGNIEALYKNNSEDFESLDEFKQVFKKLYKSIINILKIAIKCNIYNYNIYIKFAKMCLLEYYKNNPNYTDDDLDKLKYNLDHNINIFYDIEEDISEFDVDEVLEEATNIFSQIKFI